MRLGEFIFMRLLSIFAQVLGAIAIIFVLIEIIPYDLTIQFIFSQGRPGGDIDAEIARLRNELGLDKPILEQYFNYITKLFEEGSLGNSWITKEPVQDILLQALKYSFLIFGIAFIIYTPMAFLLGLMSAYHHRGKFDNFLRIFTTATYSIPPFILGIWFIVLSLENGWGYGVWPLVAPDTPLEILKSSFLPILTAILIYTGFQYRMVRNHFLGILKKDYIRTARAKGLSERVVLFKHALRNSLPTFITSVAVTFPVAFSGVAVLEIVFNIPGMGAAMVGSALSFDWPILIGGTVIYTIINAFVLLITDILIFVVSPKQRYETHKAIAW